MASCVDELTLSVNDLTETKSTLAISNGTMVGVAQVAYTNVGCFLEKLFVDPPFIGQGVGRELFLWSCLMASELGANEMIVEADPNAVPFYKALGCIPAGSVPSGSITGRRLPRLICHVTEILVDN